MHGLLLVNTVINIGPQFRGKLIFACGFEFEFSDDFSCKDPLIGKSNSPRVLLCSSSCNYIFVCLCPARLLSLSILFYSHPASGTPRNRKIKKRRMNEAEKAVHIKCKNRDYQTRLRCVLNVSNTVKLDSAVFQTLWKLDSAVFQTLWSWTQLCFNCGVGLSYVSSTVELDSAVFQNSI